MAVTPSIMRRMNQRALLRLLQRSGTATRAQLAKEAGMSQPTAGKIVDDLLAAGWVQALAAPDEAESNGHHRLGRPGQLLGLDRSSCRFIAVQLGVVHTRLEAVALAAPVNDQWAVQFRTPASAEAWTEELRQAARELRRQPSDGVIVSAPGVVDEAAQRVLLSPNAHWTEDVDLAVICEGIWRRPVEIVQEIRALALGQLAFDPSSEDFLLVDVGAGIGAAAVIGGQLATSPLPLSGELGHTPVLGNKRRCGCGSVGCIETLVSRRGLLRSLSVHTRGSGRATWATLRRHIEQRGLPAWLVRSLDAAAITIAGALNMMGLRRVVVTGSLGELPDPVMQHLCSAVARSALWARFGEVTCVGAPRRRLAGMVAVGMERLLLGDHQRILDRETRNELST